MRISACFGRVQPDPAGSGGALCSSPGSGGVPCTSAGSGEIPPSPGVSPPRPGRASDAMAGAGGGPPSPEGLALFPPGFGGVPRQYPIERADVPLSLAASVAACVPEHRVGVRRGEPIEFVGDSSRSYRYKVDSYQSNVTMDQLLVVRQECRIPDWVELRLPQPVMLLAVLRWVL